MKMVTINGKQYPQVDVDYNMLCDLEDAGISLSEISNKSMSFVRAYFASCMDTDAKAAGKEINAHIVNGGSFESLMDVIKNALEESGFFRALKESKDEETRTGEKNTK